MNLNFENLVSMNLNFGFSKTKNLNFPNARLPATTFSMLQTMQVDLRVNYQYQ